MSELKRDLSVWGAAAIVVGTVIGSGIFLVPQPMVQNVGTPNMVIFVFIFGGLLSLAGALTYAELASAMPEAGGEYVYLREAYGPFFAFLYGWTQLLVAKSGSVATLATGFFTYMANFYPALESVLTTIGPVPIKSGKVFAMCVIAMLGWLNYFGVKVGGNVQIVVTIVKVGLIALLIVVGFTFPAGGFANLSTSVPAPGGAAGFFAALVAALWAYDGWNNVSMVSSEVKEPQRNLPRALIYGTLGVMIIYLLATLAYFYVLPAEGVAGSERVAAEMMRRVWGSGGAAVVSVAAMISMFAALNGSILTGARVPYAMARDGLFARAIGKVHPKHFTPANSIAALTAWSMVLVLASGNYSELFTYVIFASWILYGMATASVLVLRKKRPDLARPYKTLGYPAVPIVFVLVAIALLLSTLLKSPRESLMGLVIMAAGIPFYLHWNSKRRT
ncbi:MAG: amino acid permease [Acidobacteria bacterium]|nr:amino acid permease [Acidobacteriota bacterium]